ncbi:MAG: hypothetical protein AAGJ97_12365, partial [Planctomycetota bacterium]
MAVQLTTGGGFRGNAIEIEFLVTDAPEFEDALFQAVDALPPVWGYAPRDGSPEVERVGSSGDAWRGTQLYAIPREAERAFDEEGPLRDFDAAGDNRPAIKTRSVSVATEQALLTHYLEPPTAYAPTGKTAPDFKGAINVRVSGGEQTVEGTQVGVPKLALREVFEFAEGTIPYSYVDTLAEMIGTTNSATFRGVFAPGRLLLLAAEVNGDFRGRVETLSLQYLIGKHAEGDDAFDIGDVTGIEKKAH